MAVQRSFDIFCRVVDNYGDIGVCWRLARQLAARPDCGPVRLWVDDLASFARIAPGITTSAATQMREGVCVLRWPSEEEQPRAPGAGDDASPPPGAATPPAPRPEPADVVIEAFACSPPPAYVARMSARQLWINLEYLSAEDWVESCHGLPSAQANGLRKFFFFPGFTAGTGGLLREPGLIARRDAWQADPESRFRLLERVGVADAWLQRLRRGASLAYVYCYPQAPLPALLEALAMQRRDALVLLPAGIWPRALEAHQGEGWRVEACTHDFVGQDDFDRLLWSSDLNIVRGEDSLVRALWAGRPMLWQAYRQQDDAHLDKLDAWLARSPYPGAIRRAMRAWNRGDATAAGAVLGNLCRPEALRTWEQRARDWCARLAQTDDLAQRLADFCAKNG